MADGGEDRRKCFHYATRLLGQRQHSRHQLAQKLKRHKFTDDTIGAVIGDLQRLGYVNDEQFAQAKAESDLNRRKQGKRRAMIELVRAGVSGDLAEQAVARVYEGTDQKAIALELAMKQQTRLRRLDAKTAQRRLSGLLQRRGFDFDAIKYAIEIALGDQPQE